MRVSRPRDVTAGALAEQPGWKTRSVRELRSRSGGHGVRRTPCCWVCCRSGGFPLGGRSAGEGELRIRRGSHRTRLVIPEVLAGDPVMSADGTMTVELFLTNRRLLSELQESLPKNEALFFLRNKGAAAATLGRSLAEQLEHRPYYRLVSDQGALANIDGAVMPHPDGEALFLDALQGRQFDVVVEMVRAELRRSGDD